VAAYPFEFRAAIARGAEGPVYRPQSWCHMHAFAGTLFWDATESSDPMLVFSASPAMANADHWQMQTHALKLGLDSQNGGALRVFGGPAGVNLSFPVPPGALPAGATHELAFSFDATTGDLALQLLPAGAAAPALEAQAQVGSWPLFQSLYLLVANDDDGGGAATDVGLRSLVVTSAFAHVSTSYPMLFVPVGGADPLSELVPGKGGARVVEDAYAAGTGLVAQAPQAADFAAWNAWAGAQGQLAVAPGATAYPVVDAAEDGRVDQASNVADSPFWARFTPATAGGAGAMSGSPWDDGKLLASSALARAC